MKREICEMKDESRIAEVAEILSQNKEINRLRMDDLEW